MHDIATHASELTCAAGTEPMAEAARSLARKAQAALGLGSRGPIGTVSDSWGEFRVKRTRGHINTAHTNTPGRMRQVGAARNRRNQKIVLRNVAAVPSIDVRSRRKAITHAAAMHIHPPPHTCVAMGFAEPEGAQRRRQAVVNSGECMATRPTVDDSMATRR